MPPQEFVCSSAEGAACRYWQAHTLAGCCSSRVVLVHEAGQDPRKLCPAADSGCNVVARGVHQSHGLWRLRQLQQRLDNPKPKFLECRPTCVSTRALSMRVLASAVSPLMATPMCSSISATFSMLVGSCRHARSQRWHSVMQCSFAAEQPGGGPPAGQQGTACRAEQPPFSCRAGQLSSPATCTQQLSVLSKLPQCCWAPQ